MKWKQKEEEHGKASLPTSPFLSLPHASACSKHQGPTAYTLYSSFNLLFHGAIFKQIKTGVRSTMGNERPTSLALLHHHRDIDVSISDIVEKFARLYRFHPCHLHFADILAN